MDDEIIYVRHGSTKIFEAEDSQIAYYRLPDNLRDFINLVIKEKGPIEGIFLDQKKDGSIGYNIGFGIVPVPEYYERDSANFVRDAEQS